MIEGFKKVAREEWNKQIARDVLPYALAPFADGGRTPILDTLRLGARGEALQMVGIDGKSPEEAVTYLARKVKEAEETFRTSSTAPAQRR